MKKVIAALLAILMLFSFAAVIFAADKQAMPLSDVDGPYLIANKKARSSDFFEFGEKAYILLFDKNGDPLTEERSISDLEIKAEWEEGEDYVGDVEFVKMSVSTIDGIDIYERMYAIVIHTEGESTENIDVSGRIYIKGRSGTEGTTSERKIDGHVDIDFTLGYDTGIVDEGSMTVYEEDGKLAYDFTDVENDEYIIYFDEFAEAVADVTKDKTVVLAADDEEIDDIDRAYRGADIRYVSLTGTFRKTVELNIYAEDGGYIYEVVNGTLRESKAVYDEFLQAFVLKTRKLGTYAISDTPLELYGDDAVIITNTSVAVDNPLTGAAA